MKQFLIVISLSIISIAAKGQNYTRDAGVRFGNGIAFTYRQFTKDDAAVEIFLGYYERGVRIGGLKQSFIPAFTNYSDNFKLYYGYGVHAGFTYTNQHKVFNRLYKYDWTYSPLFGMDGIFGLEYYFPEVPIVISADIRPYFEFSLNRIFVVRPFNISLSIKKRF